MRTGKFFRRSTPDLSIQWILDAYRDMPEQADNIVIVPVMASYDRMLETHNLTQRMVQDKRLESFMDSVKKLNYFKKDQLGEVFTKYLEPIEIKDYLEKLPVSLEEQPLEVSF